MRQISLLFSFLVTICTGEFVYASSCGENLISVQVIDDFDGGGMIPVSEVSDPEFKELINVVSSHISSFVQVDSECEERIAESSSLVFVKSPLVGSYSIDPHPIDFDRSPFNGCRIHSPWINFELDNSTGQVLGTIRWSQRQLLVDQAIMDGYMQADNREVVPLSSYEFERYVKFYADTEILRKTDVTPPSSPVPPDILWLFRKSWQSTRGPFANSARGSVNNLMRRDSAIYANLLINILNMCSSSDQKAVVFRDILDLEGAVPNEYKANGSINRGGE